MEPTQTPLELDGLVALRDQFSDVYPLSPSGARGWVRAKRQYPSREPEVYIEWDKTHWRYHGERDGWTFEHHFAPVNDEVPTVYDQEMLTESQITEASADYLEALMAAEDAALGADGFLMITLTPRIEGTKRVYEPEVYGEALDPITRQLLEAQLLMIAAQLLEGAALIRIKDVDRN